MKNKTLSLITGLCLLILSSCKAPQDIVYMQDLDTENPINIQTEQYMLISPGDKLMIHVHSRDEKISDLFNVHNTNRAGGFNNNNNGNGINTTDLSSYNVDVNGNIKFPVIGTLHVAGLTRQQVADLISEKIIEENLVKDPYITCSFVTASFYAIGDVNKAGRIYFQKDVVTLLEGIAQAGDLPITANRTNVQILRKEGELLHTYPVDLTSAASITNSPVYYLQPGDIIYVQPGKKKLFETTAMGNSVRTPTFWISLIGSALSLTLAIYAVIK